MELAIIAVVNVVVIGIAALMIWKKLSGGNSTLSDENIVLKEQLRNKDERIVELQEELVRRDEKIDDSAKRIETLSNGSAALAEQVRGKDEKIKELETNISELKLGEDKLGERLKTQFEVISNKIIEDSREKVNKFNAERMTDLMKPFEKEIKEFKEQIGAANKEQSLERKELETKIKQMVEISEGMSSDAKNLTKALRGNNKTAGNWGETILENILQNSGLTPGKEGYELQTMLRDEEGKAYTNDGGKKMIPDAIVHFPDNRNVIIDSKVSIAAYTEYCNAEDNELKKEHLKRHIKSIKDHIEELNVKSYEMYVKGSLDFVMMFIPNDYAAMVAMQEDLKLWQNAYNKKILIISPTNLITSLKIVSDLWSREKQQQNVEAILKRGQLMYDKCNNFLETFKKVGDGLNTLSNAYNKATGQLSENGGIIRQAEMLIESGIKSKKALAMRSLESRSEEIEREEEEESND